MRVAKCDACGNVSEYDEWTPLPPGERRYIAVVATIKPHKAKQYDYCSYRCAHKGLEEIERNHDNFQAERLKQLEARTGT